jgi:hypothetical protein
MSADTLGAFGMLYEKHGALNCKVMPLEQVEGLATRVADHADYMLERADRLGTPEDLIDGCIGLAVGTLATCNALRYGVEFETATRNDLGETQ